MLPSEGNGAAHAAWASWARTTTWTRCSAGCPARAPCGSPLPPACVLGGPYTLLSTPLPACVLGGPFSLLIRAHTCVAAWTRMQLGLPGRVPPADPCRCLHAPLVARFRSSSERMSVPRPGHACTLGCLAACPKPRGSVRAPASSRRHCRAHGPLLGRGLARAWRARAAGSLHWSAAGRAASARRRAPACARRVLTLQGATHEPACGAAQMRPGPTAAALT